MEDESLPYRVSYSVGGDKCQKCQQEIGFGCLRIAIMVQVIYSIISSYCVNSRCNTNSEQKTIDIPFFMMLK